MSPFKMMSTKAGYRGQEFGNQLGVKKESTIAKGKCKEKYSPRRTNIVVWVFKDKHNTLKLLVVALTLTHTNTQLLTKV